MPMGLEKRAAFAAPSASPTTGGDDPSAPGGAPATVVTSPVTASTFRMAWFSVSAT